MCPAPRSSLNALKGVVSLSGLSIILRLKAQAIESFAGGFANSTGQALVVNGTGYFVFHQTYA
jgi:hypothetical protein